jgi:hypothetical protein
MTMTRIPGFVADNSVYKASRQYRVANSCGHNSVKQSVFPQLRGFWGCLACVGTCSAIGGEVPGCYVTCRGFGYC